MSDNKFTQLCVMIGTTLEGSSPDELVKWIKDNFGCRIKFCEEVITLPDKDRFGNDVKDTGGRNDIFFYIHHDDIGKFAVPRLTIDVRWWEDIISNNSHKIYPQEIINKYPNTWKEN